MDDYFGKSRELENRWNASYSGHCEPERLQDLWREIQVYYTQPHRFYHNLSHLHRLFELFDQHKTNLQNSCLVEAAIWYHDLIYDPASSKNEFDSAIIAGLRLQEFAWKEDDITRVQKYIRATKGHAFDPETDPEDLACFLDFDLQILGTSSAGYQEYCQQIRQEYALYEASVYRAGRNGVLKQFLAQNSIFHTQYFIKHFEKQARNNLQTELKALEEG